MRLARILLALLVPTVSASARAAESTLHPGAWETGIAVSWSSVAGDSRVRTDLRTGTFLGIGPSLRLDPEGSIAWQSRASLDDLDLGLDLLLAAPLGGGPVWGHAGIGAGVRVTWVGSFRETRQPVGATLGLRTLAGESVALRGEYRYRRILGDPVADFDEHHVLLGVSYLWNNRP